MPIPIVFTVILIGGIAFLGWEIYTRQQEHRNSHQYQQNYNQHYQRQDCSMPGRNNDFEFDQNFMAEDDEEEDFKAEDDEKQDPHQLRHDATQLRSRKPFTKDLSDNEDSMTEKKSNDPLFNQDQFDLAELESCIAERKKRLMLEQAFLDKKEKNLIFRRMKLKREEEQRSHQVAASSPNEESSSSTCSIQVLDPFTNSDSDYDIHEKHSSSGENTDVVINSQSEESDAETSSSANESDDHNMSSSNLQFPDAFQVIVTDSEATDSEGSWDDVSYNEWARHSDGEYEH